MFIHVTIDFDKFDGFGIIFLAIASHKKMFVCLFVFAIASQFENT